MTDELKQPYEVLHAIGHKGDRYDKGSIVELTDEEAHNIGDEYIKRYFDPLEQRGEEATVTSDEKAQELADQKPAEPVDAHASEQEGGNVEPLSEPNPNE